MRQAHAGCPRRTVSGIGLILVASLGWGATTIQDAELWPPDPADPAFVPIVSADLLVPDDPAPGLVQDDDPVLEDPDLSETPDDVSGVVAVLDP